MKEKVLNQNFLILLAAGAIVIIVGIILIGKARVPKELPKQITTPTITLSPNTSEFFDEQTRLLTSPELERPVDGIRFRYSLKVPKDWEIEKLDAVGFIFSTTLVKDGHRIDITHPNTDTSDCVFPGEIEPREWGYSRLNNYKVISTEFGMLRVAWNKTEEGRHYSSFIVCQKLPTDNYWKTGSKIGNILYRAPVGYNEGIIEEMNNILESIEYTEL